jgi:hypothetical protein
LHKQALAEHILATQGAAQHEQDLAQADAFRQSAETALAIVMGEKPLPPQLASPPPAAMAPPQQQQQQQRVIAPPQAAPKTAKSAQFGGVRVDPENSMPELTDAELDVRVCCQRFMSLLNIACRCWAIARLKRITMWWT